MADTSVVLTLQAADAKSRERLAALYERFQAAVPLAAPLTPHITLAYYRPGVYERDMADRIMEAIERLNAVAPKEIFLENERLKYQEFTDMNHYRG